MNKISLHTNDSHSISHCIVNELQPSVVTQILTNPSKWSNNEVFEWVLPFNEMLTSEENLFLTTLGK